MIDIFTDDNLSILTQISEEEQMPGYVKQAEASLFTNKAELPKEAFAIESKKLYPIYDKASAWLSSRYFNKTAGELPQPTRAKVKRRIKEACDLYGVDWPDAAKLKMAKLAKSDHALTVDVDGSKIWKYPVNTRENLEKSVMKFANECTLLPYQWRVEAAGRFIKEAQNFGVDLSRESFVQKYACREKSVETVKAAAVCRARYAKTKEMKDLYRGLAEKSASEDPETLVNALEILDRTSGLARQWDHAIPDPYLSVYKQAEEEKEEDEKEKVDVKEIYAKGEKEEGKEKEDEEENDKTSSETTIMLADRAIPISQLTAIPLEWYEDLLGDDVSQEIADGTDVDEEKLKMILPSLPRPSQLLIASNLPDAN